MKGVDHKTNDLLVTGDEQTTKLLDLLGKRFTNHGQLLLPTYNQYELLGDDEGLQALAKEFHRWLGYKPHSVHVTYSTGKKSLQPMTVTSEEIIIDSQYRNHPLVVGGMLALGVLSQIMAKHHYMADERFIENATIQTGLGLWVINAFRPRTSRRESMYHMLDGAWLQHEGLQLGVLTKGQYLQEFSIFTSQHRLFPEEYLRGVSKRNFYLLPPVTSNHKPTPLPEPTSTHNHLAAARTMWIKLGLVALIISSGVAFGIFIWSGRDQGPPVDQIRDKNALQVIKTSLDDCTKHASDQLSTYDPNDLFMTRQVDATKSRCESLRNQYNDALDTYQTTYLK